MRNWTRMSLCALAAWVAVSLSPSAGTAAAATLTGIGTKVPIVQNDVLPVGYRHAYDYDYYGDRDYYRWLSRNHARPRQYAPSYYWDERPEPVYHDSQEKKWSPPPAPSSCGEYHYWDGTCCVDARKHPPDVSPRW